MLKEMSRCHIEHFLRVWKYTLQHLEKGVKILSLGEKKNCFVYLIICHKFRSSHQNIRWQYFTLWFSSDSQGIKDDDFVAMKEMFWIMRQMFLLSSTILQDAMCSAKETWWLLENVI